MHRFSLLFCLSICVIFVSGCDIAGGGGGDSESRPPSGDDFTYSKEAEPVDVGKVSVTEKTDSELVFETDGENLDIEEGEVIVSEVPEDQLETAPRFLREVESVNEEGNQVTVSTSSATLVDAVEEASLNLSTSLNGKSKGAGGRTWKVTSVAEGVTVKSCDAVELGNVTLHPGDSNIQVALENGSISFCPDIDGTIDISDSSLKEFSTTASGNLTYNTDLSATASAGLDLSNSIEIATFQSYGIVGPVIYTMELSLVAGFQASAGGSMSMETGIESSGSLELGARYQEGEWAPVSSRDLSFDSRPVEWGREAGATVKGYVRPELTVFLYETAGPTLFTGPYVELAAEKSEDLVTKDYQYGAFGGLNGGVGFDIEILEFGIAEYEKPIFDLRTEIAGVGPTNPAPNEPSSPDPTDGSETSGTNPTLQWDASDPDNDDLTYNVYFGTSSSPSLAASDLISKSYDPGSLQNETTYYWKVEVTDQDGATTEGTVWSFTTPSSGNGGPDEVYSEDFSNEPQYEALYQNVDEETEVYWDESSENYYAKVRDQEETWWALGKSPIFTTVSSGNPFSVSFKFNPVEPDYGHYPGISFVESNPSSNPRELSRSFTFQIRDSDNYDREMSITNSEGKRYSTPTIPAEDEWYEVTIEYNSESETIDFSVLRENGSTFVEEEGISIQIYNSFDQILIGETQGDVKYGDQAQIRVDDIEITTGSE